MTFAIAVAAGIGFFILVIASIALHEIGHLVPAKIFGVKVTKYFVGFGKTLWSKKVGETEYGVKLIPLGGFVSLLGMYPPEGKGRGWGRRLADDARAAEWENITDEDVQGHRLFYQKRTWQKVIIMLGGPAMNLLLAFGIFLGINLTYGQVFSTLTVSVVSDCLEPAPAACVVPPAKQAGVQVGDTIVAFNGTDVDSWDQLVGLVRANGAGTDQFSVDRPGSGRIDLPPVPGVIREVASLTDPSATVQAGYAGLGPERELRKVGPVKTLQDMGDMTAQSLRALVAFPVNVAKTAYGVVTGQPRDINGPLSLVGASEAAGQVATTDQLAGATKIAAFFSLLGSVNLFVAVLNLVPLPPLDGGHIVGALWEGLRRFAAKLVRRPDPGHFDTARLLPVAYVVGGFLLIAGVVLVLADIISPIRIF